MVLGYTSSEMEDALLESKMPLPASLPQNQRREFYDCLTQGYKHLKSGELGPAENLFLTSLGIHEEPWVVYQIGEINFLQGRVQEATNYFLVMNW